MLSVDICKRLGEFRLEIQFQADREPLALLGASGSGKSVTLRCVAGLLTPDEGRITLDGRTLYDSAGGINLPPQRRGVGFLFQNYALFPHMTVRQNIAAAVPDHRGRREAVGSLLRRFRLEEVADLRPRQISGGQQQRTALARLLASRPKALLLDEPLSALDGFLRTRLEWELAKTLEDVPGPLLWVTHDRGEALRNCRRVCVVDRGRSQGVRSLEELMENPETQAAALLSGCENCAAAEIRGNTVCLPGWGFALDWGGPVPEDVRWVGLRARHVVLARAGEEGAVPCRVLRTLREEGAVTVLLWPDSAPSGGVPLRMKRNPEEWTEGRDRIWVLLPKEKLMLLR